MLCRSTCRSTYKRCNANTRCGLGRLSASLVVPSCRQIGRVSSTLFWKWRATQGLSRNVASLCGRVSLPPRASHPAGG